MNPLMLAGMVGSEPTQWWQRVGTGYHQYLNALQSMGANPYSALRGSPRDINTMDPRLIQQLLNRNPNVITFGGAQ